MYFMTNLEIIFFVVLFLAVYSYMVFPLFMCIMGNLYHNQWILGDYAPVVTIIISAYNEEKDIEEKLKNSLLLDYPEDKMEIIVSSDGSNDMTNEIVAGIKDNRLTLKAFFERLGKSACLNKVIPDSKGEIIVFTDANSMFASDMLKKLVKNFYDPTIGAVSGWTKYLNSNSGEETTGLYASFEKNTKLYESKISSCVGADGAIFAIRKELYTPLAANDINDFIIPLNIIKQRKRVVLDKDIFCVEPITRGIKNVFTRQIRISTRTAWAIRGNLNLLNVFKYGSFSFFLFSHKILRLLTPFFLLATLILNVFIFQKSSVYASVLAGQLLFWLTGVLSLFGVGSGRVISICEFFLITVAAQFIGCLRMVFGIKDVVWTPKR